MYAQKCTREGERDREREREKEQQLTETTQDTGKIEKQLNILKISTSRQPMSRGRDNSAARFSSSPLAFPCFP